MPSDKKETPADTLFGWLNRPHGMAVDQVEFDWERCRRLLPDKYPVALAVPLRELLKTKRIARIESLIVDGVEIGPRYVLAVTPVSPGGVCVECGRPHRRIVESQRVPTRPGRNTKLVEARASQHEESPYVEHSGAVVGNRDKRRHITTKTTIGWRPDCPCNTVTRDSEGPAGIARPVVLDPFAGSGTTLLVAMAMGCDAVGLELNPAYIEIAKRRINQRLGLLVNA